MLFPLTHGTFTVEISQHGPDSAKQLQPLGQQAHQPGGEWAPRGRSAVIPLAGLARQPGNPPDQANLFSSCPVHQSSRSIPSVYVSCRAAATPPKRNEAAVFNSRLTGPVQQRKCCCSDLGPALGVLKALNRRLLVIVADQRRSSRASPTRHSRQRPTGAAGRRYAGRGSNYGARARMRR